MNRLDRVAKPLMWFMALLLAALTAGCGGGGGGQGVILAPPGLVSIAVTPATASVPIGGTKQFTATASYTDGSSSNVTTSSTWSSGTPVNATVVPTTGVATGVAIGASIITATYGGKTATATLTVTNATVMSIAVTPLAASVPISGVQNYLATATFSDNTTSTVTATSTWNSATPGVATVGLNTGVAVGVSGGTSLITASLGGVTSPPATLTVTSATLLSIAVTPATALIPATGTKQFTATATYSSGPPLDVTAATAWTSVNVPVGGTAIATLSADGLGGGLATGNRIGKSTITATFNGQVATAILNVTVNLRRATTFAVLAGTSITNNAGATTTTITGDVGATGVVNTVPTVIGNYYPIGNEVPYLNAKNDLPLSLAEANDTILVPCTTDYGVAAKDYGGVTLLTPGVYCNGGAINMAAGTQILTLSTPGVYIFRTVGALTPAAASSVAFGPGMTSANTSVFWVVGSASLGTPVAWKGTIMSAGALTVGDTDTLVDGRVLSSAAVTLSNNTITRPVP